MPRPPRIYIEGALYYITSEGNQNRNIFNDKIDYENYLELLAKYKKEHGFKLFAFVLLPKHLHLLIELKNNVTISAIMHDLNSLYTKAFNNRYQRKGHLFQGRFKSILLEKESYLLNLTRYVHLNPKRSGLVAEVGSYPFSSYKLYVDDSVTKQALSQLKFPDIRPEIEEVLSYFKQEDKQKAYENFVLFATEKDNFEMGRLLHRKAFVGSKAFLEDVKKRIAAATQEERQAKANKSSYRTFIILGIATAVILGIMSFYFYLSNLETRTKFNLFMYEFSRNLAFTPSEIKKERKKEAINLNDSEWVIRITSSVSKSVKNDVLTFKDGKVLSSNLSESGFPKSNYSLTAKDDGSLVWETIQTKADGSTATWYGVLNKDRMKGILSQHLANGEVLDFSFVSIKQRSRK